jgi:hypothetical protein
MHDIRGELLRVAQTQEEVGDEVAGQAPARQPRACGRDFRRRKKIALDGHKRGDGYAYDGVQSGADVQPKAAHFFDGFARFFARGGTAAALPLLVPAQAQRSVPKSSVDVGDGGARSGYAGKHGAACPVKQHIKGAHGEKRADIINSWSGEYVGDGGGEQPALEHPANTRQHAAPFATSLIQFFSASLQRRSTAAAAPIGGGRKQAAATSKLNLCVCA